MATTARIFQPKVSSQVATAQRVQKNQLASLVNNRPSAVQQHKIQAMADQRPNRLKQVAQKFAVQRKPTHHLNRAHLPAGDTAQLKLRNPFTYLYRKFRNRNAVPVPQGYQNRVQTPTHQDLENQFSSKQHYVQPNGQYGDHFTITAASTQQDVNNLENYSPSLFATEYVFDYQNNIFVTGERARSWESSERHPYIAKKADANLDFLAGGMLIRMPNQIFTNEASGHYGENWTPTIRAQFQAHLDNYFNNLSQIPITHSSDFQFNGAEFK